MTPWFWSTASAAIYTRQPPCRMPAALPRAARRPIFPDPLRGHRPCRSAAGRRGRPVRHRRHRRRGQHHPQEQVLGRPAARPPAATITTAATSAAASQRRQVRRVRTIWACPCSTRASSISPSTSSIRISPSMAAPTSAYVNANGNPASRASDIVTGVGTNGVATLSALATGIPNSLPADRTTGYPRTNSIRRQPGISTDRSAE